MAARELRNPRRNRARGNGCHLSRATTAFTPHVALKRVLSYHADSRDTLARFRREAEAAASLDHPNILPIYEVGESEEGVPFFSMKYASGGSLQEVGPALRDDPREIVRLMAKVDARRAVRASPGHSPSRPETG